MLRFGGPRGARDVEGGAVAVVDAVDVVGRCDHVKVEVQPNFVELGGSEGGDVEGGAQQAEFLRGDPDEADRVINAKFGEFERDLEETDGAGPVVIDAWAWMVLVWSFEVLGVKRGPLVFTCIDGIGMCGEHENVVWIAVFGLSNHIVAMIF